MWCYLTFETFIYSVFDFGPRSCRAFCGRCLVCSGVTGFDHCSLLCGDGRELVYGFILTCRACMAGSNYVYTFIDLNNFIFLFCFIDSQNNQISIFRFILSCTKFNKFHLPNILYKNFSSLVSTLKFYKNNYFSSSNISNNIITSKIRFIGGSKIYNQPNTVDIVLFMISFDTRADSNLLGVGMACPVIGFLSQCGYWTQIM